MKPHIEQNDPRVVIIHTHESLMPRVLYRYKKDPRVEVGGPFDHPDQHVILGLNDGIDPIAFRAEIEEFLQNFPIEPCRLQYDPKHDVSYGYYICFTCGADFYGGGKALHDDNCSVRLQGYKSCVLHFGPAHIDELRNLSKNWDENFDWYGITMADLRRYFPQLVNA